MEKSTTDMNEILARAATAIKEHPYNFLYAREVQLAFRALSEGIKDRTDETDTMTIAIPKEKMQHSERLSRLPLATGRGNEDGTETLTFDWFTVPEESTGFGTTASDLVVTLIKALDSLPDDPVHSPEEVRSLKEKYVPGTKVRLIKMLDDYAPEPGEYTVSKVDDAGQIHLKETGLALIFGMDGFEVVE